MSQKSEKYARSIESRVQDVERRMDAVARRMDAVARRQITSDGYMDSLRDVARQYDAILTDNNTRLRRELTEARKEAAKWQVRAVLYIVVIALIGAACIFAMSSSRVDAADIEAEYDAPAVVRCGTTEEEAESAENEMIEAALLARGRRLDNVTVTHYDCCVECCGKDDGITASGLRATPGVTVAVDPDVIPLGSDVLVDYGGGEIHYYRADDIGVKGNAIDLCVETHEEAVELGRRTATVWWCYDE